MLTSPGHSHYDVLGVPQDATSSQLRTAFHAAALKLHPDKQRLQDNVQAAQLQHSFLEVQRAYQVLSNAHLRQVHDRELQLASMRQYMTFQDELHVDEMTETEQEGVQGYVYGCRCGGHYWLPKSDIAGAVQHIVLPCPNCSSHVLVDVTGMDVQPPPNSDATQDELQSVLIPVDSGG